MSRNPGRVYRKCLPHRVGCYLYYTDPSLESIHVFGVVISKDTNSLVGWRQTTWLERYLRRVVQRSMRQRREVKKVRVVHTRSTCVSAPYTDVGYNNNLCVNRKRNGFTYKNNTINSSMIVNFTGSITKFYRYTSLYVGSLL